MGENIGAAARALKNFGISDLRLVSPRDGWPNQKAHDMAANASDIIENAKIFNSVAEAVVDLNCLFATASRARDITKEIITPERAAELARGKIGIIFGRESSGLDNDDISYCNYHISIPVSEAYDSMNLAQAVCVICYEFYKQSFAGKIKDQNDNANLAERNDINEMVKFLENELEGKNFFQVKEKKPGMMINIRNIFTKHFYTEQEVRTLRGIFNALKK